MSQERCQDKTEAEQVGVFGQAPLQFTFSCFRNRMVDVSEQVIWKGGLWIGIFVNRDYCRFTTDRSPLTNRPERISSLTKLRSVVWRDLLDVALSEFMNVAVSSQVDRWLATKASTMGLPVDGATVEERVKLLRTAILHSLGSSRALEGWEASFLLQTTLVRYLRGRYGDKKEQSSGKLGNFEDNDEEHDNTPEEIHEAIYVKMINGKTISTRHHRNMIAAVILDEVERRSLIPRDMIRLVHKGEMISEKKSMKENNIEAKETIEMSLGLLGGMEVNEQMDTHETEEDREKKRNLDEGKEGKMTKLNDDMAHLKRDMMEALRRSDEKMDSYSRNTDEKMECYSRKTDEK